MNPPLIYSHGYSASECFLQCTALPEGPHPLVVLARSIKRGGLSIVSSPLSLHRSCFTSKTTVMQTIPTYSTVCPPPLSQCLSASPPCSHTYPLTLNFAVKSPRAARAQRQMFPVEMRIDFSNGLCNQQFVHFHFDKKWRGASLQ